MQDFLQKFEDQLNPTNVAQSAIPVKILGYGEISTVFTFEDPQVQGWAFKRLPIFETETEAGKYIELYNEYNRKLENLGLNIPPYKGFAVKGHGNITVVYLAQHLLVPQSIGNKILHTKSGSELKKLFELTVKNMLIVWKNNKENPDFQIGLDAQISNWAIKDYDPAKTIDDTTQLWYIDTSTPMMRIKGQEQMNPLLFLKSAPPGLRYLIRKFFLQDVMDRYYDFRLVATDLVANLHKEQRPDFIDTALEVVNTTGKEFLTSPITRKEVDKYYKEDKFIWVFYLSARKIDRFIKTRLLGKRYEFLLPGKIKR